MMVSVGVLKRPRVGVFDFVLTTNMFLSRIYVVTSIYFSAVAVFVCMVYFAELAGNYFVTLRHPRGPHARP